MTAPLEVEGPAAPPRSNGELVFAEPWESRAFGMAVSLHEAGLFVWSRFQEALITRIARWEADSDGEWSYYHQWLGALEDVLADTAGVSSEDITVRAQALARRPGGHDHRHDTDHTH